MYCGAEAVGDGGGGSMEIVVLAGGSTMGSVGEMGWNADVEFGYG